MGTMTTTERREARPFTVDELHRLPYGGARRELIDGLLIVHPGVEPFTVEYLDDLPDNGCRHELIDGMLFVTPPPDLRHQRVSRALFLLLHRVCPPGLEVLYAPVGVRTSETAQVEPDLLVTTTDAIGGSYLSVAPLLVIEILSPGTRRYDLTVKRSRYEESGIAALWLIDPEAASLTVFELAQGAYVEVAHVLGDQHWTATQPFPVPISPAMLLD